MDVSCFATNIIFLHETSHNKRYIMSTFVNFEIFAACDRVFSKLSNDTNFLEIELQLSKILEKDGANILFFKNILYKL